MTNSLTHSFAHLGVEGCGDTPAHTGPALAYVHGMARHRTFLSRRRGKGVASELGARPAAFFHMAVSGSGCVVGVR